MSLLKQTPHDLQKHVRTDVDDYLTRFLAAETDRAAALSPDYGRLWDVLHRTYLAGGKRLRPYMVVLAYRACGGTAIQDAMPVAAALELLHASMLIHDDIIDRDIVRHGKPNVAGAYRSIYKTPDAAKRDHLADSAAILGGDLLLAAAHRLIAESSLSADHKLEALRLLGEAVFTVAGGELLDAESAIQAVPDVDSLAVARYKTAHYSFVTPLVMGAGLASAPELMRSGLRDFGEALGIAFQLADDLLGLFGDEEETGKPATSDLREGRRTYLLQQAYTLAAPADKAELESLLGREDITVNQLERARDIVRDCGAYDATVQAINGYTATAEQALTTLALPPDDEAEFRALMQRATVRRA